jgi:DNA primase
MLRPPSVDVKRSLEEATALYETNRESVLPYLASRGINPSTSASFRLGLVGTSPTDIYPGHEAYAGRLAIPAIGPNGVQSIRFRCLEPHDCHDVDCPKYLGAPGIPTKLFNLRAVAEATDTLVITEGELDAVVINQCGSFAVGVPGVQNWKPHYARIFTGFPNLIVVGDNDDAGKKFVDRLTKEMHNARGVIIGSLADDVSDFYTREGQDALLGALGLQVSS